VLHERRVPAREAFRGELSSRSIKDPRLSCAGIQLVEGRAVFNSTVVGSLINAGERQPLP
jgi:hypothetical protein